MEGVGGADIGDIPLGHGKDAAPVGGGIDHRPRHRQAGPRGHQVHALGQAEPRGRGGRLQPAQGIYPGAGGIDDHPGPDPRASAAVLQPVPHHDAGGPSVLDDHLDHRRIVHGLRPVRHGGADIGQGQAGIVRQIFRIDHGAEQVVPPQGRFPRLEIGPGPDLVPPVLRHRAQLLEGPHARPQLGDHGGVLGRDDEGGLAGQMGGDVLHRLALRRGFAHQAEVALGHVAQAPVDHLRGPAGGAGGKVPRLHQGHAQAALGRIPGHAGPGDTAADHQKVEGLPLQPGKQVVASSQVHLGVRPVLSALVAARPRRLVVRPYFTRIHSHRRWKLMFLPHPVPEWARSPGPAGNINRLFRRLGKAGIESTATPASTWLAEDPARPRHGHSQPTGSRRR